MARERLTISFACLTMEARCSSLFRLSAYPSRPRQGLSAARHSPGRTQPTACRDDFQSADRRIISRRTCEFCRDRFACEFCGCDGFGREFLKQVLLLGRGGSVDAGIEWRSQFDGHFLVVLARVFSCTSRDFRCKQMPSLSVLHTVPLCRRKLAPALSSPPKGDRRRKRCRTGPLGLPG